MLYIREYLKKQANAEIRCVISVGLFEHPLKVENRLNYYEALDKANTEKDYADFIQLVAAEVEVSLDLYLHAMN